MSLSRDPSAINAAVNHPAVRPFVGAPDAGTLDLTSLVENEANLFPFGEHGGFALTWSAPFTREVHTFILPEGRGAWAREAAREGIALAKAHGTWVLWTQIDPALEHVAAYATAMGMRPTGEKVFSMGILRDVYGMALH